VRKPAGCAGSFPLPALAATPSAALVVPKTELFPRCTLPGARTDRSIDRSTDIAGPSQYASAYVVRQEKGAPPRSARIPPRKSSSAEIQIAVTLLVELASRGSSSRNLCARTAWVSGVSFWIHRRYSAFTRPLSPGGTTMNITNFYLCRKFAYEDAGVDVFHENKISFVS